MVGLPDVPFEVDEGLFCDGLRSGHCDGFNIKNTVEVLDFVVVGEEAVVIFLRVELYYGGLGELADFRRQDFDTFQNEKPFNQIFDVLLGHLQVQIVQIAFVDVIVLYHFLHLASIRHRNVRVANVVHYFVVVDEFLLYPTYQLLKGTFHLTTFLLRTVNCYGCHFLVRLDETFVLLLKLFHFQPKFI